eukprot:6481963-Amphidinium_carterae.1
MVHGGPIGDPRGAAGLSTGRVSWEGALRRGRGRGPTRNLRLMADRLNWTPTPDSWRQGDQHFS